MDKRASFLKKHKSLAILPVEVSEVTVESRSSNKSKINDFGITARVEKFAKKVTLLYRFGNKGTFNTVLMKDDGSQNDGKANDNVFGVRVKPSNGETEIEYYIIAENQGALTFSPSCLLYSSPSPRDRTRSRMPSSA